MKGLKLVVILVGIMIFVFSQASWAEEEVVKLEDVVDTGTKTPHTLQDVPVETVVITTEDIERKNAKNIMDLLVDIPGIQTGYHDDVFGTYTWVAKMRGLDFNSGYGLILIDGLRSMVKLVMLRMQDHFPGMKGS